MLLEDAVGLAELLLRVAVDAHGYAATLAVGQHLDPACTPSLRCRRRRR
jgi:hypothetical protein